MCNSYQERSSLQSWIGVLQEKYPSLSKATIIYDITESDNEQSIKQSIKQAQQAQLAT